MSRFLIIPLVLAAGLMIWLWASGGFDGIAAWAAGEQRAFQNEMAQALRSIRAGQPGAIILLMSLCFAYGFFHAIGPGHGKVLIGGYGLARDVPWMRLSLISLASSLGQAVTAVALVYAGVWVFNLTRERMIGVTEGVLAPASYAAIGLIGLWLIWRGARKVRAAVAETHDHDHHHHHHDTCSECGHKHGPSLDDLEQATNPREVLSLIAGIAMRPCTGALFVLIITWQMGIGMIGVAGAFAMALGTATVTIAVGLTALGFRGGLLGSISDHPLAQRVVPVVEITAGLLVASIATGLLLRSI